jgi:serine/threonine protein kinase
MVDPMLRTGGTMMTSMSILNNSPTTNYLGQRLGNYQLVKFLGQGGFATIYLAKHRYLGTYAAVKVLNTRLIHEEIETFCFEARTAARLIHPHIVRVLEFGLEDNIPFLVMDYAPHGTLRQWYAKGVMLPLKTILLHIRQIASALQFMHGYQIIHQDIKPENMLVGSNHQVLLSDFGISVTAHKATALGTKKRAGTVTYMAPEQIQGKPCLASDQYALGVVVYEWLCGAMPFQGSVREIINKQLFEYPPLLQMKVPTIPIAVEQVVMRSLEKDPQQRFPNVQAFAQALEQAYTETTGERNPHPRPRVIAGSSLNLAKSSSSRKPPIRKRQETAVKKVVFWKALLATFVIGSLIGAMIGVILGVFGTDIQKDVLLIWLCLVIVSFFVLHGRKKQVSSQHA